MNKRLFSLLLLLSILPFGKAWLGYSSCYAKIKPQVVYIFGFSASFNDSTVYFTDVQKLDSAFITKEGFLVDRAEYSNQLKTYLQDDLKVATPTTMVTFGTKKAAVEKKYNKMLKKYLKFKGSYIIKMLTDDLFRFTPVGNGDYVAPQAMPKGPKGKKGKKGKKKPNDKMKFNGGGMEPPSGGMGGPGGGAPPSM